MHFQNAIRTIFYPGISGRINSNAELSESLV
jgi:hypothetical protein